MNIYFVSLGCLVSKNCRFEMCHHEPTHRDSVGHGHTCCMSLSRSLLTPLENSLMKIAPHTDTGTSGHWLRPQSRNSSTRVYSL